MKLKLNIPIVRENPDGFDKYKVDGTIEVEFDEELEAEKVNFLLANIGAQFALIADDSKIQNQITMAKGKLCNILSDLNVARSQLARLDKFLKGLGVNPREHILKFDEFLKLRSAESNREGESGEED